MMEVSFTEEENEGITYPPLMKVLLNYKSASQKSSAVNKKNPAYSLLLFYQL